MGDGAYARAPVAQLDSRRRRALDQAGGVGDLEDDDVGFDGRGVDLTTPSISASPSASRRGVLVVLGQPLDVVLEAQSAPAATIPAWRIAPPNMCL